MIKTFADRHTYDFYLSGHSRRFPFEIPAGAKRRLAYLENAVRISDLKVPPSNRLHALSGERKGLYATVINDPWRMCFSFEAGNAYGVEISDYH